MGDTYSKVLERILQRSLFEGELTLMRHLGNDIVFVDVPDEAVHIISEDEMFDGEFEVVMAFEACGYELRYSKCLYVNDRETDYTQRVPAPQRLIQRFLNTDDDKKYQFLNFHRLCIVLQVLARRVNSDNDQWTCMCLGVDGERQGDSIDVFELVKMNADVPDDCAELFVRRVHLGSPAGDYWYRMNPEGKVTEYQERTIKLADYFTSWR